jgi:hypothetical protein
MIKDLWLPVQVIVLVDICCQDAFGKEAVSAKNNAQSIRNKFPSNLRKNRTIHGGRKKRRKNCFLIFQKSFVSLSTFLLFFDCSRRQGDQIRLCKKAPKM